MKKIFLFLTIILFLVFLGFAQSASAHLPRIIYNEKGDVSISDPEVSQAFYDELGGDPRNYLISSDIDFNLYINLLVPSPSNSRGRYSAKVFIVNGDNEQEVAFLDGQTTFEWKEFYEPFGRDYYFKGPELEKKVGAGDYKIVIFSYENRGKYVLAVGKQENFPLFEILNIYWKLPVLKMEFFKTDILEFFLTPFGLVILGIAVLLFIILAISVFVSFINEVVRGRKPKMLLLTSSGMAGVKEEILSVLPKPVENVRLAHIITASKVEEDTLYVDQDLERLKEAGFNVTDIDIEGKNKNQLMDLLEDMDMIYVQGGNTFYLLSQMRRSGFDKIIKKLLRKGIIYVGVSAGSVVMGKTIKTAEWFGDENIVKLKNLKGLKLVNLDIFVHYRPEDTEVIKQKLPKPRHRKHLKILTDEQALFVYGRKVMLIGEGEAVKIN